MQPIPPHAAWITHLLRHDRFPLDRPPAGGSSKDRQPARHTPSGVPVVSHLTRRSFLKAAAVTIAGTKSAGRVSAQRVIRVASAAFTARATPTSASTSACRAASHYLIDPDRACGSRGRSRSRRSTGSPRSAWPTSARPWTTRTWTRSRSPTPNHWHSLVAVWACQAGKDVYVEKPMSHLVGRAGGAWRRPPSTSGSSSTAPKRSSTGRASEIAAVQSGKYGKLLVSKGYCCKPRWSIGTKPTEKPPAHLAFDLWLGPARSSRTTPTWSITTGTGSGTSATGTSATRGARDGRGPVGDQGRDAARQSGAWAGGSGTRTRGRPRTPR